MTIKDIKKILGKKGERIVIVENDKPLFVVLPFEEYLAKDATQEKEEFPAFEEGELTLDDLPLE